MNRTLGATTPWLIISAAVVIIFGGALTWYNIKYPSDDVASTSTIAPTTSTTATTSGSTATTGTTSTNDTNGLKTYSSTSYNYHFSYPSDWVVETSQNGYVLLKSPETQEIFAEIAKKNVAAGGQQSDIIVNYYENLAASDGNTPKKYQTIEQKINDPMYYSSPKAITFAGVPAYEAISSGMTSSYSITVQKDGHIYEILFNKETKAELTSIQKQFISSFSF